MIIKLINMFKTLFISNVKDIDYSTWIFSSSFNTKFNYNSKYLFEYVLNNKPDITPLYVINNDELRKELQNKYGEKYFIETNSITGIKKVLSSGVWFTSAGLPVYGFNLNKNRFIINLWHGIPLKKIALMEENISKYKKIYFKYLFTNNYTYILTTSSNLVPTMAESFGVSKEKIKVWGQPRNDSILKKQDKRKVINSLYTDLPPYKRIILYAPTYREKKETNFFPFNDFDSEALLSFLDENQLIIFIRSHQSETKKSGFTLNSRVRLINENKVEDIAEVINVFDLLITDYSSIYIDYLLTEQPVLFLPYDKEEYLKDRGLNFDYKTITPGPKPETFEEFKQSIISLLNNDNFYKAERKITNDYFNEIQDVCAEDIVCKIENKIIKLKDGEINV